MEPVHVPGGQELHLPVGVSETAQDYIKRSMQAIALIRESAGFGAILDVLDGRERELWVLFSQTPTDSAPDRFRDIAVRASEVAFLRNVLTGRAEEGKKSMEAAEVGEAVARQQRLGRTVDRSLARHR